MMGVRFSLPALEFIMYRLHIDIPLGTDEETAVKMASQLMEWTFEDVDCKTRLRMLTNDGIEQVNYRLGHDEDRQKSNYLDKNENGHCSNKKTKISI